MPARRESSKLRSALVAGIAVAVVVALLRHSDPGRRIELTTHDLRTEWTKPKGRPRHPELLLVVVTEESIKWAEKSGASWPWHREFFAYLFKACNQKDARAAAVLFDLFTLGDLGEGEEVAAEAIAAGPPAYLAVQFRSEKVPTADQREGLEKLLERYAIEVDNDGSVDTPDEYLSVVLPRPGIAEAATGVCDVSTPRDVDGVVRRYRLFSKFRGNHYPSLALAALMAREGTRRVEVRRGVVRVGKFSIPVDRTGTMYLRYYTPEVSFHLAAASEVINAVIDAEEKKASTYDFAKIKGKVIIIGTNAAGLFDVKQTPVAKAMAGTEIQATAFANMLDYEELRAAPPVVNLALLGLCALVTAFVVRHTSAAAGGAVTGLLGIGCAAVNVALFKSRWIVDLTGPMSAIVLAWAVTTGVNFLFEGRQKMRIKRDFQRYLSPRVVEKILQNPDALRLEGERKPLTIFFMDFAGFTSMSEKLDPAELVRLISEYHHEAAEEIFRTEGTIDKYIGDAIMAFWNDPIEQADHALRACLAAVGAQKRLRALAARMKERGLPEMRARIGINTGLATVGNMGARGQVNYTAIGDEVNLASRLEGVNKEFGTEMIVSEATRLGAQDRIEVRELALIKVKGRKQPVRIFELLGLKGEVAAERLEEARRFEQGLAEFRARRFQQAWQIFMTASGRKDPAAEPYLALCELYSAGPPPPDWDGAYQMETK